MGTTLGSHRTSSDAQKALGPPRLLTPWLRLPPPSLPDAFLPSAARPMWHSPLSPSPTPVSVCHPLVRTERLLGARKHSVHSALWVWGNVQHLRCRVWYQAWPWNEAEAGTWSPWEKTSTATTRGTRAFLSRDKGTFWKVLPGCHVLEDAKPETGHLDEATNKTDTAGARETGTELTRERERDVP